MIEFPRLLAGREIIANALLSFFIGISPPIAWANIQYFFHISPHYFQKSSLFWSWHGTWPPACYIVLARVAEKIGMQFAYVGLEYYFCSPFIHL